MSDPTVEMGTRAAAVGLACASIRSPQGMQALYESNETQKRNFGEADKAEGSGQVAVMQAPENCRNAITDYITYLEDTAATLIAQLPEAAKAPVQAGFDQYKNMMVYFRDANLVAIVAQASATNAAFTTTDAVIGVCLSQPAVTPKAACWGYQQRSPTPGFDGYTLTAAEWNALSANSRKLDPTVLSQYKHNYASQDIYKEFICSPLPDSSPVIDAGYNGALCLKLYPPKSLATDADPHFELGATTVYIYNSTRTTAQATAANRNLAQGTGFQGNEFYSYDVNIGALSGISLSAAAISALVLSYF